MWNEWYIGPHTDGEIGWIVKWKKHVGTYIYQKYVNTFLRIQSLKSKRKKNDNHIVYYIHLCIWIGLWIYIHNNYSRAEEPSFG